MSSDVEQHSRSTEPSVVEVRANCDINLRKSDLYCEYLLLFTISEESLNFIWVVCPL